MIHIGDSTDYSEPGHIVDREERVEIPIWHTGIFAQSGMGKTKLLKYMISQAVKEHFRVIIFDSKVVGPEFVGIGQEAPLFLRESTDPDVFRSLLEDMRTKGRGNMERYRGGFIELCDPPDGEPAKDFAEIEKRLQKKLSDKKIRGSTRLMYYEINHDLVKLKKLIQSKEIASEPSTPNSMIVRYPTWQLPSLALQGLVVKSVIEEAMPFAKKTIFVIDEAPNFIHQRKFNPAKDAIQTLDAQGRSNELFGWYCGQTLTGFDKANMKNLWYWVIGREMEPNEAKDAYDIQTTKILSVDQIRTLKVRQFIVATPDTTKLITVPMVDEKALFPLENVDVMPWGEEIRPLPPIKDEVIPSKLEERLLKLEKELQE